LISWIFFDFSPAAFPFTSSPARVRVNSPRLHALARVPFLLASTSASTVTETDSQASTNTLVNESDVEQTLALQET